MKKKHLFFGFYKILNETFAHMRPWTITMILMMSTMTGLFSVGPLQIRTGKADVPSWTTETKHMLSRYLVFWGDDMTASLGDTHFTKWVSIAANVTDRGGSFGVGFIPGNNNWPFENKTYTQEQINRQLSFMNDYNVWYFYHCWNHSVPYMNWHTWSLQETRNALNFTVWTWYNNFGFHLHSFLGYGQRANYNTMVALAERNLTLWSTSRLKYSERYEDCEWLYISDLEMTSVSPFVRGGYFLDDTHSLESWKSSFSMVYNQSRIIRIATHPNSFDTAALANWSLFLDWIYENHNIINLMNDTQAIQVKNSFWEIDSVEKLDSIRFFPTEPYVIIKDIDFDDNDSYENATLKVNYTVSPGFEPISYGTGRIYTIDGANHTISNLIISTTASNRIGLFSYALAGSKFKDLGIINAVVTGAGKDEVGILVGNNRGVINRCFTTGTVTGTSYIGGLVGRTSTGCVVNDSYSLATVHGVSHHGGLVGRLFNSHIDRSYSAGAVSANGGGLVGTQSGGTASDSFWDNQTSGQTTSALGMGRNTSAMQTLSTFADAGWNITCLHDWAGETWYINEGDDYPRLSWECTWPVANFSWIPVHPMMEEDVQFTDCSYDTDGSIVNWSWDFGEGNTSYEHHPIHQYSTAGDYLVCLTVMDDDGAMNHTCKILTVETNTICVNSSLAEGWNLFSLPLNQTVLKEDIVVQFEEVNYSWFDALSGGLLLPNIFGWNRSSQDYIIIDTFESGKGYWIYAYYNCTLWINGSSSAVSDSFITTLSPQWNIVGAPCDQPIETQNLMILYNGTMYTFDHAVNNNIIVGFIFQWNESFHNYELTEIMQPGKSYWMYAYQICRLYRPVN